MPHTIELQQDFPHPVSRVFADLADHENLGRIMGAPMKRIVDGTGPGGVNGVGSVRRIGSVVGAFEERVVAFEQDRLIEYTVTKGSPIENHLGRMVFSETPSGSRLLYQITFDSKVPFAGGLIAAILRRAIRKGLQKYAAT